MRTEVPNYEPDTRREDEDARQIRWDAFMANLRNWLAVATLTDVLSQLQKAHAFDGVGFAAPKDSLAEAFMAFAETEGWSGVLSVVAQAEREQERFRGELMDRR